LIKNITLSLMLVVFVSTMHVPSAFIFLLAELCILPAIWFSFRQVRKYGEQKNEICTENVSSIVEYIHGIQTFRAYGIAGIKNKTVTNAMKSFCDISFTYELKVIPIGMVYSIVSWFSLPLVIYVAGMNYIKGNLNAVTFLMICLLPLFLTKLLGTIFIDLTSYKNLMIAKKKIEDVITSPEENKQNESASRFTYHESKTLFAPKSYGINFNQVRFSYHKSEPVCKDINLSMEDGKLTAIVGDSGSGKSTILNLIMKYYEPTSGEIRIGGCSTKEAGVEQVLSKISMVDQEVFLFDDTIRNNIRYARENATDEEIEWACKEANCDEFIKNLSNGYETMAGENGNQLSGGERQRISIARAILKDSPILLLDEATANLDVENELAVKNAISNLLRKKKTVVMIAHTLSIVKNADKIIVIADGRVKEEGTHDELIRQNGKYSSMWIAEQQLSKN
jgi:ATP-binding cassette, subfamily B, bacterial IrtB/YbtQ